MKSRTVLAVLSLAAVSVVVGLLLRSELEDVATLRWRLGKDQATIAALRANVASLQGRLRKDGSISHAASAGSAARHAPSAAAESDPERIRVLNYTHRKVAQRVVQQEYAEILATMKLSPEKMTQLKELLVERSLARQDAWQVASQQGIRWGSPGYAQAMSAATSEEDQKIATLLGPEDDAEFVGLLPLGPPMQMINASFGGDMDYAGVPLTGDQKVSLAKAMAQIHYSTDDPLYSGITDPVNPATGLNPLNEQLVESAAGILSAEQINILKEYQKEQSAFQAYARTRAVTISTP